MALFGDRGGRSDSNEFVTTFGSVRLRHQDVFQPTADGRPSRSRWRNSRSEPRRCWDANAGEASLPHARQTNSRSCSGGLKCRPTGETSASGRDPGHADGLSCVRCLLMELSLLLAFCLLLFCSLSLSVGGETHPGCEMGRCESKSAPEGASVLRFTRTCSHGKHKSFLHLS